MTKPLFLLVMVLFSCFACRHDTNESKNPVSLKRTDESTEIEQCTMFRDVANEWGIEFSNHVEEPEDYNLVDITGSGCALLDVDQDGLLDVVFAGLQNPNGPANRLFQQVDSGNFEDVTEKFGIVDAPPCMGVAVGDCNNDGWPDLYLPSHRTDTLWLNQKGKSFLNVTTAAGLENIRWGAAATWIDFDRDGWLDLYVVNYVDYQHRPCMRLGGGDRDFCAPKLFSGTRDRLYRNITRDRDGVPTFEDVTQSAGIGSLKGRGMGVLAADFTADGWPDFYIANDQEANRLWVNQQDGTFEEEAVLRGCALGATGKPQASMGLAFVDLNADQHEDLLVSHLFRETHAVYLGQTGSLYREESLRTGVSEATRAITGFGIAVEDFDCDGALEVITANGHVNRSHLNSHTDAAMSFWSSYSQQTQVLRTHGELQFSACLAFSTPLPDAVSRGLACGDLDGDGDVDVVISNTASPSFVLENIAEKQGAWLMVRLFDPVRGGRTAYGAKCVVTFSDESRSVRTLQPCASFSSTHAPVLHLACPQSLQIQTIDIVWPDGTMQPERFHVEELNTTLELVRGQGIQVKE